MLNCRLKGQDNCANFPQYLLMGFVVQKASGVTTELERSWSGKLSRSVGGVTVSMVAFQAVDPGSTPG